MATPESRMAHDLWQQTALAQEIVAQTKALVGDDDEEVIANAVEGETNLREAIESALKRIAELGTLTDAVDRMIDDLKARKDRFKKQRDTLREMIAVALETVGEKRMEFPLATVSLKAVAPSVEIVDESQIPLRFWKPKDPELNRKDLLAALKDKEVIPGAALSNGGVSVQIKFA